MVVKVIGGGSTGGLRQALSTIVVTQSLRYWLLASWALGLGTCIGLPAAATWLGASVIVGLLRGRYERALALRESVSVGAELTGIATASSLMWSVAPVLAFYSRAPGSPVVAAVMLLSGCILVVTQFRHMPRRALIVSSPYTLAAAGLAATLWGRPEFLPFLAAAGIGGMALFTNVLFGRVHKAQIEAFQSEQSRLLEEMEEARDRADKANQAKSDFLAMISHELRTPMNGVLGAAHMLKATSLQTSQSLYVDMIHDSGDALMSLLNDMLDFAKIEAGRVELENISVSIAAVAARVAAIWETRAQAKGLDFHMVVEDTVPDLILGDPTRLSQILHNLLSNAVKFTAAGAITLRISASADAPTLARIGITVCDTGPGISEEDQARLFLPFNQLDASSTRQFGGTGLGLAISRRLARLMEGDLTVASTPGTGSSFALEFDATVAAWRSEAADADAGEDAVRTTRSLQVLVVEDHPVNQRLLQAWLDGEGHVATMAGNGQLGLEAAAISAFDLVLMDVNMPVMDGLTAVRRLRETPGPNQQTAVVMLSASARAEDHEAGFAAGADAYLNKPIDFHALQAVLARVGQPVAAEKAA